MFIETLNAEIAAIAAKEGQAVFGGEHCFEWCVETKTLKNDMAISPIGDFRSEFIQNLEMRTEAGNSEAGGSAGASSGQVMSAYLKNSEFGISGINGSSYQSSSNGTKASYGSQMAPIIESNNE